MHLPPLREVITRFGLDARKSLGQHFLLDERITRKIVKEARIHQGTHIVEVGPGPGGLTRALLESDAAHIYAIEKDARCVEALQELQSESKGRLSVIAEDALTFDWRSIPAPRQVVANLPYNVGTLLLLQWLDAIYAAKREQNAEAFFTSLTLMFQKEVAERIIAEPDTGEYGRLSVITQWLCETAWLFDLPPGAFSPPPKVTSSVVTLIPHDKPLFSCDKHSLEKTLAAAFNQRRKMLRGSLKSLGMDTEALLEAAGIDGTRRAGTLNVEEFCRLANCLYNKPVSQLYEVR